MTIPKVSTDNLPQSLLLEEVLGNARAGADRKTIRTSVAALSLQLVAQSPFNALLNTVGGGLKGYQTLALLEADLTPENRVLARVYGDTDPQNNGIYVKNGAAGAGNWQLVLQLRERFIVLENPGTGTADAIIATSSSAVPDASAGTIFVLPIVEDNTEANVTVTINGQPPRSILSNTGGAIAPGYLVAGTTPILRDDGVNLRMLTDGDIAASVLEIETARDATFAARDEAIGAVPLITFFSYTALRAFNGVTSAEAIMLTGKTNGSYVGGGVFALTGTGGAGAADDGFMNIRDAAGRTWSRLNQLDCNVDYHEDVDPSGIADSTAGLQTCIDNFRNCYGFGLYEVRGLHISGTDTDFAFSSAQFTNNVTDGSDTFLIGDDPLDADEGARACKMQFGKVSNAATAGHAIKVIGTCRGVRFEWDELRVENATKNAFRAYRSEGAQMYDCVWDCGYTRGKANNLHEVPICDLYFDTGVTFQGNRMRFGYAYGSKYQGGSKGIRFMRLHTVQPCLNKSIHIDVAELCEGGVLDIKGITGTDVFIDSYDTDIWFDDQILAENGRGNTYRSGRKGGTRTTVDFTPNGGLNRAPMDIRLVNENGSEVYGQGSNTGDGKHWYDLGNGSTYIKFSPNANENYYSIESYPLTGWKDISKVRSVFAEGVIGPTATPSGSVPASWTNVFETTRTANGKFHVFLNTPIPSIGAAKVLVSAEASSGDVIVAQIGYRWASTSELILLTQNASNAGINQRISFTVQILD
jgi:hypothetical protein